MSAPVLSNAILASLDHSESAALRSAAQHIPIERGELISEAGQPAPFVYFPTEGVLSLVGTTAAGGTVELAVVGNEGVASISAILGRNYLPFRVVAQVPGHAVRVPTDVVSTMVTECGGFHDRLLFYTHQVIAQVAQSAICNRFHTAKQRLARWLLMTADRADCNELPLTHEFISYMVGGPRSAVTEAAADLRESGAIDYRRGLIVIRDPRRLQEHSCECYQILLTDEADEADAAATGTA